MSTAKIALGGERWKEKAQKEAQVDFFSST
jgi:hypothetical protein